MTIHSVGAWASRSRPLCRGGETDGFAINTQARLQRAERRWADEDAVRYRRRSNHLMLEEEPAWSLFLEELGRFLNYRG